MNCVQNIVSSTVNEIVCSGWKITQWMENYRGDETFAVDENNMWMENGLRMKIRLRMKFQNNNSSSLALRFNTFTTHILPLNDPNVCCVMLKEVKSLFQTLHVQGSCTLRRRPFHPIVFFWCLPSCNLLFQLRHVTCRVNKNCYT